MIPVETFDRNDVVASYRLQDIDKARTHRDKLRAEGRKSFLTKREGRGRYDAVIQVWAERPSRQC